MKLEWIELENFRQYFVKQRIVFAKDKLKNVTVLHGANGAGKTSLFLALNWCLYGKKTENIIVIDIDNVGQLVSKEAVQRTSPGKTARATVSLSFLHNGYHYLVRRVSEITKEKDGTVIEGNQDELTMQEVISNGKAITIKNPIGKINTILPPNVREYFFFDGEKIDNMAKKEASPEVKKAISLVLKLELLMRSKKHLIAIADDYRKELTSKSSGELRSLREQDQNAHNKRERLQKLIEENNEQILSARSKIADIDQTLMLNPNATELEKNRERIEQDRKQRKSEREKIDNRTRDLISSAYFASAQIPIERAVKLLNEKRERGEIPSSIREQFVQDLIESRSCICGRSIEEGSSEYELLTKLLHRSVSSSMENAVLDTSATLKSLHELAISRINDLQEMRQSRIELGDIIMSLEEELDDVKRQLKDSKYEEISKLEERRGKFDNDIQSYMLNIAESTHKIKELTEEINNLEIAIKKARKAEDQGRLLEIQLDIAQGAADSIDSVFNDHEEEMREKIEAETKEIFKSFAWKGDHFQDVRLGRDFKLEVIDRWGKQAKPEFSMGERQVLSLSFITAMSRVSEEEAPLVIDTPFGRLSSEHREAITRHLPDLTTQLILFVTDEELRDEALTNLRPRIGKEYRLEFNKSTSCTTIVEGEVEIGFHS